jgi:hypothetical protein
MLTADYFSYVLHKRRELLEESKQEIDNLQMLLNLLNQEKQYLCTHMNDYLQLAKTIDEENKEYLIPEHLTAKEHYTQQLPTNRRLQLFDEKLQSLLNLIKKDDSITSNSNHNSSLSSPRKQLMKSSVSERFDTMSEPLSSSSTTAAPAPATIIPATTTITFQPPVTVDQITQDMKLQFQEFQEKVRQTMENCYQMTEKRLKRLTSSRTQLTEGKIFLYISSSPALLLLNLHLFEYINIYINRNRFHET